MFGLKTSLGWLVLGVACAFAGSSPVAPEPAAPATSAKEATRAKEIRNRLSRPVTLEKGIETQTTLREALEFLGDRYELQFLVDAQAFKEEGAEAVEDMRVGLPKLIGLKLSTILRTLLTQVGGTYLIRSDHIEITTMKHAWVEGRNFAPTVSAEFDKCPLHEALRELADSSGISVVVDGRASDRARTSVSATFNNVPIHTAVLILADMADLKSVVLDNVLYVTTKENAEYFQTRQEEQRKKANGS